MGFVRLFLAALVLISHMAYTFWGLNPGVWAVVIFYLLAGQVVASLWQKAPLDQRLKWFLRDRALRILPVYFVSLLVVVALWFFGLLQDNYFLSAQSSVPGWLANFSIVPLSYFMYNGTDTFTFLPPAWSLGVELQFYLLVPLLLSHRRLARWVFVVSLLIFIMAQVGVLHSDHFGYRLLPGVLWVFLCGMALSATRLLPRYLLLGVWLSCCVYATYLLIDFKLQPYLLEVALGFVIGLPLVYIGTVYKPNSKRYHYYQRLAGAYSYPVFLIHLPLIWCLDPTWLATAWGWLWVLLGSLVYAIAVHHLIEIPLWQRLRPMLKNSVYDSKMTTQR